MYRYILTKDGELYHYGVKGMKWGVRRPKEQLKYDSGSITTVLNRTLPKIKTANGIPASEISIHALGRISEKADRKVSAKNITDALTNPLKIKDVVIDEFGRPSQRFIGSDATVNVNPSTGIITTVWKTGRRVKNKYSKKED